MELHGPPAASEIVVPDVEPVAPAQATEPALTEQIKQLQASLTKQLQKVEASTAGSQNTSGEPPMSEEARVWLTIEKTESCGIIESYVSRFPSSVYADFAKARYIELRCDEQVLAAVSPTAPDAAMDVVALAIRIQSELKRFGCYVGEPDGQWGGDSIAALERYNQQTQKAIPVDQPTLVALDSLKVIANRVCHQQCQEGFWLKGGKCMRRIEIKRRLTKQTIIMSRRVLRNRQRRRLQKWLQ